MHTAHSLRGSCTVAVRIVPSGVTVRRERYRPNTYAPAYAGLERIAHVREWVSRSKRTCPAQAPP